MTSYRDQVDAITPWTVTPLSVTVWALEHCKIRLADVGLGVRYHRSPSLVVALQALGHDVPTSAQYCDYALDYPDAVLQSYGYHRDDTIWNDTYQPFDVLNGFKGVAKIQSHYVAIDHGVVYDYYPKTRSPIYKIELWSRHD